MTAAKKDEKKGTSTNAKAAKTAPLAPAAKNDAKAKTIHYAEVGADRAACGTWAGNPNLATTTDRGEVTCKGCLAVLNAAHAGKERKPDVVITCVDCGKKRTVTASQAHVVKRCEACQKKHLRDKRKEKVKARKARKLGERRQGAAELLAEITEGHKGITNDELRALAAYIYQNVPADAKVA